LAKAECKLKRRFGQGPLCAYRRVLGRLEPRHFSPGTGFPSVAPNRLWSAYHVSIWRLPTDSQRGSGVRWRSGPPAESSRNSRKCHHRLGSPRSKPSTHSSALQPIDISPIALLGCYRGHNERGKPCVLKNHGGPRQKAQERRARELSQPRPNAHQILGCQHGSCSV
jgi:hypothetical protein